MDPAGLDSVFQSSLVSAAAANATPATNATVIVESLLEGLVKRYPNVKFATDFKDKSNWVFNNAGGAMGSMFIIHASITE